MINPFRIINTADGLEIKTINSIFNENKVWDKVLEPFNHIIIGSKGSGKSILLKRLSASSMEEKDFPETYKFFGIYLHLSRITRDFNTIFNPIERSFSDDKKVRNTKLVVAKQMYSNYVCLHLIKNFCEEIENSSNKSFYPWSSPDMLQKITDEISSILDLNNIKNIEDITTYIDKQLFKIDNAYLTDGWLLNNEINLPHRLNINTIPETLSKIIYKYTGGPEKGMYVYFLLDTSELIHPECQKLHNSFFERGFSFRTKLAKRPYHLNTLETLSGRYLKPDTEFSTLFLDYVFNDKEQYKCFLVKTIELYLKYIKTNYSEFSNIPTELDKFLALDNDEIEEYFSIFTTVSIRNFINFLAASWDNIYEGKDISQPPEIKISKEPLKKSLKDFAKNQFEGMLQVEPIDKSIISREKELERKEITVLYEFLKSRLKHLVKEKKKMELLHIQIKDLFISEDIQTMFFKPAFAEGVFRFLSEEDSYLLSVPNKFYLSPVYLISEQFELYEYKKGIHIATIDEKGIRNFMKRFFKKGEKEGLKDRYTAFLSCSFEEAPLPKESRDSIKKAAKSAGIDVYDAQDLGITELTSGIRDKISKLDFFIVELSKPTPNIMFELGICAAFEKFFRHLIHEETNEDIKKKVRDLIPYTYYEYNLEEEKLKETFKMVREAIESRIEDYEKLYEPSFEKTTLGRLLKPKGIRTKNMIYISYPGYSEGSHLDLWEKALTEMSSELKKSGLTLITDETSGLTSFEATPFTVPIYCISQSRFCAVDTSGKEKPDLFQSYVLGLCYGLKRNTIRIEQRDRANKEGLSLWTFSYGIWVDINELKNVIFQFISQYEKKG